MIAPALYMVHFTNVGSKVMNANPSGVDKGD